MMLKKLREAVADIEQMKADLVGHGIGRPAKHPSLAGAAHQKKKRKVSAAKMAPWLRPLGQHAQAMGQRSDAAPDAQDGNAGLL